MPEPEWRRLNGLHWEDRVAIIWDRAVTTSIGCGRDTRAQYHRGERTAPACGKAGDSSAVPFRRR